MHSVKDGVHIIAEGIQHLAELVEGEGEEEETAMDEYRTRSAGAGGKLPAVSRLGLLSLSSAAGAQLGSASNMTQSGASVHM